MGKGPLHKQIKFIGASEGCCRVIRTRDSPLCSGPGEYTLGELMHFHYVLSLGAVFAMFAGFYYWLEKIIGVSYSETLGKIHF